jgi:myo-inositol 2-dehydrogenase/D-chiro-inositol 1-dehydrogenase
LAAVCDLDEQKALAAQRTTGFGAAYTDFREMLETEKPDAVFCVGGPKVHYPVGMEVLDRGFPLYVQKPPAPSSATTREMAALAARKHLVCHVGFNLRSAPATRQAKSIITGKSFGRTLLGIFRYGLCSNATWEMNILDQHVHLTDLARHLAGEVSEVRATRTGIPGGKDYVAAVKFASGAVGTLNFTSGQIFEKEFLYYEVTGEGGVVYSHGAAEMTWQQPPRTTWLEDPAPNCVYRHGDFGLGVTHEIYGYVSDTANFLAAVRGEEEDRSPVADSVGSMELCEELLRQVAPEEAQDDV